MSMQTGECQAAVSIVARSVQNAPLHFPHLSRTHRGSSKIERHRFGIDLAAEFTGKIELQNQTIAAHTVV